MIIGIGIDAVEIQRCAHWHMYNPKRLKRLFCQEELDYCLATPAKSAERFAARFAAKEAFYKALCAAGGPHLPFFTIARQVQVVYRQGKPVLEISGILNEHMRVEGQTLQAHVTITHTTTTATAMVILEEIN